MRSIALLVCAALAGSLASAQPVNEDFLLSESVALGEGWAGFRDLGFMLNAVLTLTLAAVLGAVMAYHPKHGQTTDTLEDIEAPKVFISYSVIGALIGIMVVKYGLVVGFVLFGIGGLIRFRTLLRSASLTGHVIFVTLIGLSCGLELPHVAVLATAFGFILTYILDAHVTYRLDVQALPLERFSAAAEAYRSVLERAGCRILSEKKTPVKQRVVFIFRGDKGVVRSDIERMLDFDIDPSLRGTVDWLVD